MSVTSPPARSTWAGLVPALTASLLALSACAGPTIDPEGESPREETVEPYLDEPFPLAIDDPWEGMNRVVYAFNAQVDRKVLLPVVRGYRFTVPPFLRDRVRDFFANINNLTTFANQILQLDFTGATATALRFGVNFTFGIGGLLDWATAMGMDSFNADFGQTLGTYGVDGGPYLVLPLLGPSNVRDAVGTGVDIAAFSLVDPFSLSSIQWRYPPIFALNVINARYVQPFRYFESGSPFEYDLVRYLYTKKRELQIGD